MTATNKIRVTVEDLKTGEKDVAEIWDNYIIVCAGSAYVDYVQKSANGTDQITIKGRREP